MANTFSTTAYPKVQKESPFDEVNSLLAYSIYHERDIMRKGDNLMKYYLKNKTDREHDAANADADKMIIEILRSVRFIENKINSRFGDNRMTSIQLYFNNNKGGTIKDAPPNPLLFQLNIRRDCTFVQIINDKIIKGEEDQQWVKGIMAAWEESMKRSKHYASH